MKINGMKYESLLNTPFSIKISSRSVEVFLKILEIDFNIIYRVTRYNKKLIIITIR